MTTRWRGRSATPTASSASTSPVWSSECVPADDPGRLAERLIAAVDGVALQALFDPESWPPVRQLDALDEALDQLLAG